MDKEENRNIESKTGSERKQCQEASVGEKARYGRFRVTFSTNYTTQETEDRHTQSRKDKQEIAEKTEQIYEQKKQTVYRSSGFYC